jgi:hypothetical protein
MDFRNHLLLLAACIAASSVVSVVEVKGTIVMKLKSSVENIWNSVLQ